MGSDKTQRKAQRAAHRQHLKAIRRWMADTGSHDWCLAKVREYPDKPWRYRYLWLGPRDTETFHIALGTDHSVAFLAALESALREFRISLAAHVTHVRQPVQPPVPLPITPPWPFGEPPLEEIAPATRELSVEVFMEEEDLTGMDRTI